MPPRARSGSDRSDPAASDPAASEAGRGDVDAEPGAEVGDAGEGAVRVRAAAGGSIGAPGAPGGGALVGGGLRLPLPPLPPGLSQVDVRRLLWWGGLGALATVGILEWPVALVVGVGSLVAERLAREPAADQRPAREARVPE